MQILLNGQKHLISENASILELIKELNLDISKIAIECNLEIVSANHYNDTYLKNGDTLEIVQFIGGG